MTLIYTNAVLTAINAPGTIADFDIPAAPGAIRWSGSTGVTIRRDPIVEIQGGETLDVIRRTRMEINYDVGYVIQHNDTLTYTYEGATVTRRVDDVSRNPEVGRIRVELEPA